MRRLMDGDDSALALIMERWRKPILAFLYRIVGDYETAADLSQEVFVRLYQSRHRYRPSGSFSSFIFTIASNLSKNHFRWRKRHPETELSDKIVATLEENSTGTNPSTRLERSEEGTKVKMAVQQLPEKLRIPVVLFHFNDLSHAEISGILKCSVKSVETRLYRARKMLKDLLGGRRPN
jgi:RNA polymerase sigma-70 factor (ECF subfamily)